MTPGLVLDHDWFPRPLPENVTMGERSWWYSSFACIHCRSLRPRAITVGHDSGIYHGTFFNLGPDGEVEIGNFCTLVGAIISTNGRVMIRDYAFIAHEVVIADSFVPVPWDGQRRETVQTGVEITIGENSWIGARAVLLPGASIGEGAIIGAAAVIDFAVPPFATAVGNPARIVTRQR